MKKYSFVFDGVNVANTILFGVLVVFSHCALAQIDVETKSDQSHPIVLKAGSYVDAREGRLVWPAILVIDRGIIVAIKPPVLPEDSTVVDLGEATHLPGLIDVHTHLMIETGDATELVQLARNNSESDFLFAAI